MSVSALKFSNAQDYNILTPTFAYVIATMISAQWVNTKIRTHVHVYARNKSVLRGSTRTKHVSVNAQKSSVQKGSIRTKHVSVNAKKSSALRGSIKIRTHASVNAQKSRALRGRTRTKHVNVSAQKLSVQRGSSKTNKPVNVSLAILVNHLRMLGHRLKTTSKHHTLAVSVTLAHSLIRVTQCLVESSSKIGLVMNVSNMKLS